MASILLEIKIIYFKKKKTSTEEPVISNYSQKPPSCQGGTQWLLLPWLIVLRKPTKKIDNYQVKKQQNNF